MRRYKNSKLLIIKKPKDFNCDNFFTEKGCKDIINLKLCTKKHRILYPNNSQKNYDLSSPIFAIYQKLYDYYGPQNWWPAESDFEVIVGAILTQNTAWQNVEKAIQNLKTYNLLTPQKLWAISEKKLYPIIKPSGFYRLKTKRLKAFLDFMFKKYDGSISNLKNQKLSILRKEMLEISGIGEETADSILLYALKKPVFVIDAYTRRTFSRHNFFDYNTAYSKIQEIFMRQLPKSVKIYQEYHALLVKLAKDYCQTKPKCSKCPMQHQFLKIRNVLINK